ncbi:MAG: zinc-dependent alcohol dehydrogenase [Candidatus Thorarchaeota archaeon]|jgi:threonine dehydrogenase-like Zn-dependent dehydrogenase
MKGIMYNLNIRKIILKKLKLAGKFSMIKYREDWPIPEIKHPNQIQVKSRLSGICTSDLHQIDVSIPYSATILARREKMFPNGHEVVADVTDVGDSVEGLRIGDRVVHSPIASCEAYGFALCPSCKNSNPESCYTLAGMGDGSELEEDYGGRGRFGGFSGGGFSEYFVGFAKQFTKVPPELPDEIAVLSEPYAVSLHSVCRNQPKKEDVVVVIGAGIIGLMVVASIRALEIGCKVIVIAKYPFQGEAASKLGADQIIVPTDTESFYEVVAEATGGVLFKPRLGSKVLYGNSGPDIIYDTVGDDSTLDDALHLIRSNGKIVILGMDFGTTKKTDWALGVYKELEIVGSMMHGVEEYQGELRDTMEMALEFMAANPTLLQGLVTHRFAIEEYKNAFRFSSKKGHNQAIKVAFDFKKRI